jgi:hypothetical protein
MHNNVKIMQAGLHHENPIGWAGMQFSPLFVPRCTRLIDIDTGLSVMGVIGGEKERRDEHNRMPCAPVRV